MEAIPPTRAVVHRIPAVATLAIASLIWALLLLLRAPQPAHAHSVVGDADAALQALEVGVPLCTQQSGCYTVHLLSYTNLGGGQAEFQFQVIATNCPNAISHLSFGNSGLTPLSPSEGPYNGTLGNYSVEHTGNGGQPGHPSVKFDTNFSSYNNASETFTVRLGNFNPATTTIKVEIKAAGNQIFVPFSFTNGTGICVPQGVELAAFEATAQGNRIAVTWETVSELDNLGFHLWRSTSAAEQGTQLNGALIPSQAPGSPQGFVYGWDDATAAVGVTYFYWLEAVDLAGGSALHGPVSAHIEAPTAVTLGALDAAGSTTGWPWLAVGAGLVGAGLVVLRRQRAG